MTYYRLLRDNKETGPFAEDEMIAKGFKPYDLIWVEGRSAGWRYPSEIPAFKNFAPVVEEQPYDRFYKKQPAQKLFSAEEKDTRSAYIPSAAKNIATADINKNNNNNIQPQQFVPAANVQSTPDYTIQPLPGRHIHVTLPSGNTVNLTTLVAKKENKEPIRSGDQDSNNAAAYTETKHTIDSTPGIIETPVAAQPVRRNNLVAVPQIKEEAPEEERYTVQLPQSHAAGSSISWGLIAASFIGFATLVGLGIMIGIGIGKSKNEEAAAAALRSKPNQTLQAAPGISNKPASIPDGQAGTGTDVALPQSSASNKELVQNAVVKNTVLPENSNESKEVKKTPAEKSSEATKNKTLPEEAAINIKPVTANIEKTLSLTSNDFKTGAFGGISGLKYSLFNGSRVALESVEVEVDYIQANDKVFKTEKLLFKDIPAGTQATIDAPASSRGVKVSTRIIKINAKEGLVNTTAKS